MGRGKHMQGGNDMVNKNVCSVIILQQTDKKEKMAKKDQRNDSESTTTSVPC